LVPQRFPNAPGARIIGFARQSAAALAILAFLAAPGIAADQPSGFNFCAKPAPPACIDAPETTELCEVEVQAFLKSVFKYRACLEKESARAVREANETLEIWKCRTGALQCR
jgi:hypothetical protein